jgi:DNA excision repair protein ERCC-2
VAPLIFVLDDRLRPTFLQWMGVGAAECHLIVDEAHHLPAAAREHHSPRLTLNSIQRAQREAEEFSDPVLAGAVLTSALLDALTRSLLAILEEFVRGEGEEAEPPDGLVPPGALQEELLSRLRVPTPTIERALRDLDQWGEVIREDRRKKGKLPRSHLGAVASFLRAWLATHDAPYVNIATAGANPALQLFLLDPAGALAWVGDFWSTVHMSGTLSPVAEHASLCGLAPERTTTLRLPSPFDPSHLRVVGIEGVHRRWAALQHDPGVVQRQQEAAYAALRQLKGRTALFFPSYSMMEEYLEEGFLHAAGRPLFVEEAGMTSAQVTRLADAFRREPRPGALLLGVLGGRLSEGLDFPGEQMDGMLIFGVPYPRPSARQQALIHYFDAKAGTGWQVAVHTPVGRALRQAVGRLIRGPDDRGTAVILDERIVRFRDHLAGLVMVAAESDLMSVPSPWDAGYRRADRLKGGPTGGR